MIVLQYSIEDMAINVKSIDLDITTVRQIQQFKYSQTVSAQIQKHKTYKEYGDTFEQGTDKYKIITNDDQELYISSSEDLTKDTRYMLIEF